MDYCWSKFLRVLEPDHNSLITGDSFFIDEEKKVAMGGNIHCTAKACSYVPSLVQIKQPAAGGKRKHQSDLEKQRYDQNMSRLVSLKRRGTEASSDVRFPLWNRNRNRNLEEACGISPQKRF
ncbi:hypothetical protein F2Q70_00020456 [Brassica cretica]|uniref:Uncharacterized protein n=1 Tax=Brassica cretica TaxID=69181 RepID=A0A8S9GZ27_BRACR|nr:hypothetical protein F2Q70_00020456 [Brassica cretica]KAF3610304.1 hypothetical protein DY000_02046280 [Brassica cretica]